MKFHAKAWRCIKLTGIIVVVLVVLVVGADVVYVLTFSAKRLPANEATDAIVVLGAAPNSPALYNRTMKGLELFKNGEGELLVFSGGKIAPQDETEAQNMLRMIQKKEKYAPPVLLEDTSHNTFENLYNTKAKIPDAGSIIIVSDKYHLPRAVMVAKRLGFNQVFWASPNQDYYSKDDLRWYYIREMVALLDYLPKLIF